MDTIKVLVVDDHTLFRRGIAAVLTNQDSLEVVGDSQAGRGSEHCCVFKQDRHGG